MSASSKGIQRAFPSYRVFGENNLLLFKPILPKLKRASGNGVTVERVGKLLVEFTPRVNRAFQWDMQQNFALTAEECALIQHQLPAGHPVELSRRSEDLDNSWVANNPNHPMTNLDKVLFVEPTEGASVTFSLDYIDTETGVRGGGDNLLSVKMMAGEFGVFQNLVSFITPHLLGWPLMVNIGANDSLPYGEVGGYKGGGGGGFGGGAGGAGGAGGEVPF
ncbi:hypothetical protein TrCOL_g12218 [Triparma columacea]|uniref:Uncharacterized protein n=1 Tax=Triparma columacea TaxID=722753 RepID=A0A9W7LAU1_9STRA|nr:hypothetical protein TrCOL_g12218 [Triparma columacea]